MFEVATAVAGIVVGYLTALWFERRALKAARSEANELRIQLDELRASVLSIGGPGESPSRRAGLAAEDADVVLRWLRSVQDVNGRVSRMSIYSSLIQRGYTRDSVTAEIARLTELGSIRAVPEGVEVLE
ncbi:MAG: hypothetical protein ABW328_06575 [Ilumatobacteraceae bacterium]